MTALAVVIVAHDSAAALRESLPALLLQLRESDEVVLVDAGSAAPVLVPDGVRVLDAGGNVGFAGGAVLGAAATSAPLLFFLNPDCVPQPGCLDALREAPGDWGAWQALVLLPDGRVNTDGNVVHWTGIGWAGRLGEPPRVDDAPREVGFASGAALVVRRGDWDRVGGFDPGYFMYGEDLDLSLRLRLAGRGVGIVPDAVVEHDYTFTKGEYKWFHLERNRWLTVLAVYPTPLLLAVLPALLALEVALLAVAARDGWLRAKLRAQLAVLRVVPAIRARRRATQPAATVTAAAFSTSLGCDLDSPHVRAPGAVARMQAGYWQWACKMTS